MMIMMMIISHTTVISIAYLASPDSFGSVGIIIYFLRRKYPAGKASKGLTPPMTLLGLIKKLKVSELRPSNNR